MELIGMIMKYSLTVAFLLFLLTIPVLLVFLVVRMVFKGLSKALATVTAAHIVLLLWWVINQPQIGLYDWAQLLVAVGLLCWLGLRPNRGSIIALLIYQVLGSSNLLVAFQAPWGHPLHRIAVTGAIVRLVMVVLLLRELHGLTRAGREGQMRVDRT